jgi:hypothetical protein
VIFKKLLTRRNKESSEVKQYLKPYPNDFTVKCDNSISLLKKAKGDSEKILASQAEQLAKDSETVWGWVDLEGNVKSESESIALSATFTLQHLPG